MKLPPPKDHFKKKVTMNDFALIDEMSGLNDFLDNFMMTNPLPETSKDRIRALMVRYDSPKPKEIAMQELKMAMFGD